MGADDPAAWVRSKRTKLRTIARGEVARHTRAALAVCMPSVPVAAALGFALNGDPYNTTGWKVGDERERAEALRKGRRPFVKGDPTKGYGAIGSDDLHELGWFGVEGGHCPTPVATDPDCPWVQLADSEEVVKILGRPAVTGGAWYGAVEDQCAVGIANLLRHMRQIQRKLDPRIAWPADRKPVTLWQWSMACISWSAGTSRAARHVNAYAAELGALEERRRVGEFMRLAAAIDDDGGRHRQDEYSALRDAQKREGGRAAAALTGEGDAALAFLDDGLGADRAAVHARLVATSQST
ncbi:MAG: hypothetical protein U0324_29090 [Polyangiales bacterium]